MAYTTILGNFSEQQQIHLQQSKHKGYLREIFPCFIELTPWPSFGDYHHLYDIFSLSLVKFLSWKKDQA